MEKREDTSLYISLKYAILKHDGGKRLRVDDMGKDAFCPFKKVIYAGITRYMCDFDESKMKSVAWDNCYQAYNSKGIEVACVYSLVYSPSSLVHNRDNVSV